MPRVSVLSPAYNHEAFVVEAIESVLSQTFTDFELVITDDCSTDATYDKLRQINDPRITLMRNPRNRGAIATSAHCYQHSTGEYIAWIMTDDVCEPNMLEVLAAYLDAHPDVLGVFAQARFIDDQSRFTDRTWNAEGVGRDRFELLNLTFRLRHVFCSPAAIIRRSAFEAHGYFPPHIIQCHDMYQWMHLLFHGPLTILPDFVLRYRWRSGEANLSAPRPENVWRFDFECFQSLSLYAEHMQTAEVLTRVFPEVKQHPWPIDDRLVPFHLAHVALAFGHPAHRMFGLDLLYQQMRDPETAAYITRTCGFDYPDMFALQAAAPVLLNPDPRAVPELHKAQQEIEQLRKRGLLSMLLRRGR